MILFSLCTHCSLLVLPLVRMLPEDGLDLLLHKGPRHGGALQRASLTARTERLEL